MRKVSKPSLTLTVDSTMIKDTFLVIPKGYWNIWKSIPKKPTASKKIKIMWGNGKTKYDAYIRFERAEVMRLRWKQDLHQHFRKAFCYSCFYEASRLTPKSKNKSKKISPRIPELLKIIESEKGLFKFKPLSTHVTELTPIFRQLIENGYLDDHIVGTSKSKKKIFQKSSSWLPKSDLKDMWEGSYRFVIYYLLDSKKREMYIGKTKNLKSRIYEGRKELPGWDYFRYDILMPAFRPLMGDIEGALIKSYSGYFGSGSSISHEISLKNIQNAPK